MRHLKATILAIVLFFFVTIVLSHTPISVMAHEKVETERLANMTSCESNNPNAVEVNGICFETLIPEPIVNLPKYGEETPIQFGVRITNQTSTPYRFDLQLFLPEILDSQGKTLQRDGGQNVTRLVEESDIPLLIPGESLNFLMDAKLNWYKEHFLRFIGSATYGGVWIFWISKPGEYQVRFIYLNQLAKKTMFTFNEGRAEINEFWTGKVITPFRNFHLSNEN